MRGIIQSTLFVMIVGLLHTIGVFRDKDTPVELVLIYLALIIIGGVFCTLLALHQVLGHLEELKADRRNENEELKLPTKDEIDMQKMVDFIKNEDYRHIAGVLILKKSSTAVMELGKKTLEENGSLWLKVVNVVHNPQDALLWMDLIDAYNENKDQQPEIRELIAFAAGCSANEIAQYFGYAGTEIRRELEELDKLQRAGTSINLRLKAFLNVLYEGK